MSGPVQPLVLPETASDGLPEGWVAARLPDVARCRMGKTILAKELSGQGVPVYSAGRENSPWGYLKESDLLFDADTVVLSARGSIGFPKLPATVPFVSTQTTIAVTFPSRQLAEYGRLWLETVDWHEATSGATIPMLTIGQLASLPVLLPPVAEQKRIVARVEDLLAHVNAAREALARVPVILRRFRQAVLAAACDGRLTNHDRSPEQPDLPDGWSLASVANLTAIQSGRAFPSKQYCEEGLRLLRPGNLHVSGRLTWTAENTVFLPKTWVSEAEAFVLGTPELLMNLTAQSLKDEFLGRVCMKTDPEPALLNQRIARFKPLTDYDCRPYLLLYFKSPRFRAYVDTLDTGSLIRHMSTRDLLDHEVPLPPQNEQSKIVRRVESLFKFTDGIEARVAAATARAEKLTQAILAKAFRGELVPAEAELARREGRTYEPAAALLGAIRRTATDASPTRAGAPGRPRGRRASAKR